MLKIKWFFMLQCFLQTIAILSFTTLGEIPIFKKGYIPVSAIAFVFLKCKQYQQ